MKSAQRFRGFVLVALGISLAVITNCTAAEFSADLIERYVMPSHKNNEFPNGAVAVIHSREYVKGHTVRGEYHNSGILRDIKTGKTPGQPKLGPRPTQIVIRLLDKGVAWLISTRKKIYCEQRFPIVKRGDLFKGWKKASEETVNGYVCKKYTRVQDAPVMIPKVTQTLWWSEELEVALKSEARYSTGDSDSRELTNIVVKKLPDSLFQPPKGYVKKPCPKNISLMGRPGQYP